MFNSFHKKDVWASVSLLLVAIPICAGIAVASKADPADGILAAIIAAIIFSLFSSTPLTIVGPSAGLSIFVSMASIKMGGESGVSHAIFLAGVWLVILSFFNVQRWINIVPRSVIRGMVTGMGLILIVKMLPHLLGYDGISLLESDQFTESDGRNTITEVLYGLQNFLPGSITISIVSTLILIFLAHHSKTNGALSFLSPTLTVVTVGVVLNQIFIYYYPAWALGTNHTLHFDTFRVHFRSLGMSVGDWKYVIQLSIIITAVISLEGLITLDVFQKIDPTHSRINTKKELRLLGITNSLMGFLGLLPVMPVLIRSTAAVDFGAKSRWTNFLHAIWLIVALIFYDLFSYIPMATVATILVFVGFNLISFRDIKFMATHGKDHWLPFFVTVIMIFFTDLIWGIFAGFSVGLIFSLKSVTRRTMVLVHDQERYLLKFYKDVTFLNKGELREHLESIPKGAELLIDGTGNIFIDTEIEEWLEDFSFSDNKVTFMKSRLAVSRLFKEIT